MNRRDFIRSSGLAVAGMTGASLLGKQAQAVGEMAQDKVLVASYIAPDGIKRASQFICTNDHQDQVVINEAIQYALDEGYGIVELAGGGSRNNRPDFIVSKTSGEDYAAKYSRYYMGVQNELRDTHPLWFRGQGKTVIYLDDNQNCDILSIGDDSTGVYANESSWITDLVIHGNKNNQSAGNFRGVCIHPNMNYGWMHNVEIMSCKGSGLESNKNRYWIFERVGCHGSDMDGLRLAGGYQNEVISGYAFSNGHNGYNLTSYQGAGSHRNIFTGTHAICNGTKLALFGYMVIGNDNSFVGISAYDEYLQEQKTQEYGIVVHEVSERNIISSSVFVGNKIGGILDHGIGTIKVGNSE